MALSKVPTYTSKMGKADVPRFSLKRVCKGCDDTERSPLAALRYKQSPSGNYLNFLNP
ncbi:hypothetical protein [Scytonema sp. PCC 10023]|uniref:hypothetical protein n=1 Tax=Scytonema sp. PCC 10023 TaxID=1680591 RepID=UPI0039C5B757